MKTYDLLNMGRSSIDLYSNDVGSPFVNITSFAAYVGGSPTNISVGAHRLGLKTALLTADEIYKCSLLAAHSGIHVIKTSTGFSTRGASLEDIEIIKNALNGYQQETGNVVGIKASGGVRSLADAFTFIKAGVTRIGTSGGADIVQGRFSHSMY